MSWGHLSISAISQLLLARFGSNFKQRVLGPYTTDYKCQKLLTMTENLRAMRELGLDTSHAAKLGTQCYSLANKCASFFLKDNLLGGITYKANYFFKFFPEYTEQYV